tara:strand:- start:156 stop:626 length:471 start_codon:yes stop_codon:yes gene_type:complete
MKKTAFAAFLLFSAHSIFCQETIPVTGGEAIGSGGLSYYSIGQMVFTTNYGNGTVSQGIQLPITVVSISNEEITSVNVRVVAYPNPATKFLILAISDINLVDIRYSLFDMNGRVLSNGPVTQENTNIDMLGFASGIYGLIVHHDNKELKSFKIIKK